MCVHRGFHLGGSTSGGCHRFPHPLHPSARSDLFLYGLDARASNKIANEIEKSFSETHECYATANALTFTKKAPEVKVVNPERDVVFQLVFRTHRNRAQVLEGFDLAPCKALARVDANGALVVEALPSWVESMRTMVRRMTRQVAMEVALTG